jgi:hypothetical protein
MARCCAAFLWICALSLTGPAMADRPPWPETVRPLAEDDFLLTDTVFATRFAAEYETAPVLADFDGDGTTDTLQPADLMRVEHVWGVALVDLNDDGHSELIVRRDSGQGYSWDYYIFQKRGGNYVEIGSFRGYEVKLLSKQEGYYQIESRPLTFGATPSLRELTVLKNGRYRLARIDEFSADDHDLYLRTRLLPETPDE